MKFGRKRKFKEKKSTKKYKKQSRFTSIHENEAETSEDSVVQQKPVASVEADSSSGESDIDNEHKAYDQLLSIFSSKPQDRKSFVSSGEESESDANDLENPTENEQENVEYLEEESGTEEDEEVESEEKIGYESNDIVEPGTDVIIGNNTADISDEEEEEILQDIDLKNNVDGSKVFNLHFERDLSEDIISRLSSVKWKKEQMKWAELNHLYYFHYAIEEEGNTKSVLIEDRKYATMLNFPSLLSDLSNSFIKKQMLKTVADANKNNLEKTSSPGPLTPLQHEVFSVLNSYHDLYYPEVTLGTWEEIRFAYVLHVANHVVKSSSLILRNNAEVATNSEVADSHRDQGFTRPKVLILLPFRELAVRVINILSSILLTSKHQSVVNMARFVENFSSKQPAEDKLNRPEDFQVLFSGNSDDNFKIGVMLTKNIKMYSGFYSSDIILASPLGLRTLIGAEGEKDRDYDFLSSIEILILDHSDVFLMQNWDHLLHVFSHLHLQPRQSHDTDFNRVRMWTLNGLSKYYRQTLIFSQTSAPEFTSLFNKHCHNFTGKVLVQNPVISGSICHITLQLPQTFHRFDSDSPKNSMDARFSFFMKHILPQYMDCMTTNTLIFVPSYFDYVRLRNHFKKEEISAAHICEYTKKKKIAVARGIFYRSHRQFLFYTERFHFYRRYQIRGIRHILFYQLPQFPNFYSELCNLMQDVYQNPKLGVGSERSCSVIYSKYDVQRLAAIVGTTRAAQMINSEQKVHMFVTGE